jgi:invasin-like protein/Big-like domain-containing protein
MRLCKVPRGMGRKLWRWGMLAVVAGALALPAAASASSVSNVSVLPNRSGATVGDPKAGEHIGYDITFTATSGITDGTTITIDGPAGMSFPGGYEYQINIGHGGCLGDNPVPSNNNRTITITESFGCTAGAGQQVEILAGVSSNTVVNPTTAGSKTMSVSTSKDTTPAASGTYTIYPDVPAHLDVSSGDSQSTAVGTAFAAPLVAKLSDQYGNGIGGTEVDFSLPTGLPQATGFFPGPASTASPNTDSSGLATSPSITATTIAGQWHATAQTVGGALQTSFTLNNTPGPAAQISLGLQPETITADGVSTSTATATVKDANGNSRPGDAVVFTAPNDADVQVSATTDNGDGTYSATLTAPARQASGDAPINAVDTTGGAGPGAGLDLHLTGDIVAPETAIDSAPPDVTTSTTPEVDFHSDDPNATFKCKLDDAAEEACTSPFTAPSLKEGHHTVTITATDAAGNVGSPQEVQFTVDAMAPTVQISGPSKTKDRSPTFKLKPNEDDVTFECRLDDAAYKPCGSTYTPHHVKPGHHTLKVRVTDAAANKSVATKKFTVKK